MTFNPISITVPAIFQFKIVVQETIQSFPANIPSTGYSVDQLVTDPDGGRGPRGYNSEKIYDMKVVFV